MSVPIPEKLRCSSGMSPVKMSQMPSKNVPRFFGNFIGKLLSGACKEFCVNDLSV
jgi:hypothetical protein